MVPCRLCSRTVDFALLSNPLTPHGGGPTSSSLVHTLPIPHFRMSWRHAVCIRTYYPLCPHPWLIDAACWACPPPSSQTRLCSYPFLLTSFFTPGTNLSRWVVRIWSFQDLQAQGLVPICLDDSPRPRALGLSSGPFWRWLGWDASWAISRISAGVTTKYRAHIPNIMTSQKECFGLITRFLQSLSEAPICNMHA
jgi:hypothetical protein